MAGDQNGHRALAYDTDRIHATRRATLELNRAGFSGDHLI
jgi:hypothetical protein